MTCREASNLLPLFFDGELDAHQMRTVALHSARCTACESELRQLEGMQDLISQQIYASVDEIDFSTFWPAIEGRLSAMGVPWWSRLRAWWSDGDHGWLLRWPAVAAVAAGAAVALFFLTQPLRPTAAPEAARIAAVDNAAMIESLDSLETDVDSVAVLNDPETRTMVLWVSDENAVGGDVP